MKELPDLTPTERGNLQSILFTQGYQVLLKLMEAQCEIVETNLLKVPNHDTAQVISAHNTAKATRSFFENFQKLVQLASINPNDVEHAKQLSPEEIIRLQLQA